MIKPPSGSAGWDDYADFYDWENAQTMARRDVPFWQRLASPPKARCSSSDAALAVSRCRWRAPA